MGNSVSWYAEGNSRWPESLFGSAEYADNKPDLIEPQDPFQITDGGNDDGEDDAEEIDITQ